MNKLKSIRVQKQDGTYTSDIPIAPDAENVLMRNGNTLQDTIGSLDINSADDITTQLLRKIDTENAVPVITSTTTSWLNTNVTPVGSAVVVDSSLSTNGAAADAKRTGDEITDFKKDLNKFVSGKNLIDPVKVETNTLISAADGRTETNASYNTSGYIPITIGQSVTISPNCRKFLAFDANKTAIQSTYINAGVNGAYTYTATVDGFVKISYLITNTTEQIEYGTEATAYEPYNISIANGIELSNDQKTYIENSIEVITEPIKKDLNKFVSGKNLIDPVKVETNTLISAADGRTETNASYNTSGYIPIASGQKVTISPKCRKFLAFDNAKTAIQSTYVNAGTTDPYTFTASVDGYVRISYLTTDSASEQVEYGDTATTYEAYKIAIAPGIELNDSQKEYIADQLEPLEDDVNEIKDSFTQVKSDLIEFTTVVKSANNEGYYNNNGAYDSSSSYFYSDLIAVMAGDKITAETATGIATPIRFITAYSDSTTVDKNNGWNNSTQLFDEFTVASGVVYIRATLYATRGTTQVIKKRTIDGVTTHYANTEYVNPLTGKKWVACGDSFTQGDFSGMQAEDFQFQEGKYKGKNKVYPYFIGLHTGAEIVNEAISGSTMAYVDGTHHEFSAPNGRYTQIPSDADYITLYFGINDSHHQIPIGTISDNTNTTFYGAWNIVMQYLITNHPNAKIGIIISNGCDTIDYPNAEIAIAQKYGVAYLDINSDYKVPILFRVNGKPNTAASTIQANYEHYRVSPTNGHPNPAMHEYESTII